MAGVVNCQDPDDLVRVSVSTTGIGVVVLVVDPRSSTDLIVDCPRKAWAFRLPGLSFQDARGVHGRLLPWGVRNVVVELLGTLESNPTH